jgi:hypothetical protein
MTANWTAESVVFVVFSQPVPGKALDALQPWMRVFGAPPAAYQGPAGAPIAQAMGTVGDLGVAVVAQFGRLDLKLSAGPSQGGAAIPAMPPGIPDVGRVLVSLETYARDFLKGETPARVSLVMNLRQSEDSAEKAIESFRRNVPIVGEVPADAADLTFAINVPKIADVDGQMRMINRTCRWGTGKLQAVQVQFSTGTGAAVPTMHTSTFFVSTLQIDLSATSEIGTNSIGGFTNDQALATLKTMIESAKPILDSGYSGLVSP